MLPHDGGSGTRSLSGDSLVSVTDSNPDGNTRSQGRSLRPHEHLVIVGASVRAAAFSALRAGLRPWCADLFADADLRARCPAVVTGARGYRSLLRVLAQAPPGPWMYTGALENHPRLVAELTANRQLWGIEADVLRVVRRRTSLGGGSSTVAGLAQSRGVQGSHGNPARRPMPCQTGCVLGGTGDRVLEPRGRKRPEDQGVLPAIHGGRSDLCSHTLSRTAVRPGSSV